MDEFVSEYALLLTNGKILLEGKNLRHNHWELVHNFPNMANKGRNRRKKWFQEINEVSPACLALPNVEGLNNHEV
jgi:hypothetical protein